MGRGVIAVIGVWFAVGSGVIAGAGENDGSGKGVTIAPAGEGEPSGDGEAVDDDAPPPEPVFAGPPQLPQLKLQSADAITIKNSGLLITYTADSRPGMSLWQSDMVGDYFTAVD